MCFTRPNIPCFLEYVGSLAQVFLCLARHFERREGNGDGLGCPFTSITSDVFTVFLNKDDDDDDDDDDVTKFWKIVSQ